MILTKRKLTQRLINGEKLTPKNYENIIYCYYDETHTNPFRYMNIFSENISMNESWNETEWETYKEIPVFWEPKDGEKAYYIDAGGKIATNRTWDYENVIINQANVFKTKEEAEKESRLRTAKYKVKKRIWELNREEFIEYKDNTSNWSFDLNNSKIEINSWYRCKRYPSWQYLKSKDAAEQLVKEMYNELLLIRSE